MRITLIRHGDAGEDAPRDEERSLTKTGRAEVQRVGEALERAGVHFGAVIASPLVRAVQTAEMTAAAVGYRGRVVVSDRLIPDAFPAGVLSLLSTLANAGKKSIALVAHEPVLSRVAAMLLHIGRFPPLRKAEAVRIRLADGAEQAGAFRWRIDPKTGRRRRR
jgi:phosphohistidine phosphatase